MEDVVPPKDWRMGRTASSTVDAERTRMIIILMHAHNSSFFRQSISRQWPFKRILLPAQGRLLVIPHGHLKPPGSIAKMPSLKRQ